MESLPTPHNNFFHFALSHLPNARSLIETQLPASALAELDLTTLQLEPGSFIDPDLREKFSDLLFTVELARSADDEQTRENVKPNQQRVLGKKTPALVYFLFEHKSKNDRLTAFQLLTYIVRVWEKRLRDGQTLCPIVPLVVYHGQTGWTAARSLAKLIPYPQGLADDQVDLKFRLLDLAQAGDQEIPGDPILQSKLRLLKYSRSVELRAQLRGILELFAASLTPELIPEWIRITGAYIVSSNNSIDEEQYLETVKSVFPTKYEPGSHVDRAMKEGERLGLEKGKRLGMQEGEMIGRVHMLEEILGDAVTPSETLVELGPEGLSAKLADLQRRLQDRDE